MFIWTNINFTYTTFSNFSMKYIVMCNVYTDVGGIKMYTMFVYLYVIHLLNSWITSTYRRATHGITIT